MLELFHFQQPGWFLAFIPMALLLWWLPRAVNTGSSWQKACASHLLPYLLNIPVHAVSKLPLWLLASGWLLAVIALADPVWQKQPQAVFRSQDATVVVLDLSQSMLSSDLAPSRMERARLKVADILKQRQEGQTGLVVFAGDAFTVSPLTSDTDTILSLLKPLQPNLMPVQGSRADLGMRQAGELLKQAQLPRGEILLITDGYSEIDTLDMASALHRQGYRVSVLGVGSDEPAPIADAKGGFLRDGNGNIVMPRLDTEKLQQLADAGGGLYNSITSGDADLERLISAPAMAMDSELDHSAQQTDVWQSQGPWLVLALLLLAAPAFRRGWLLSLPLIISATFFIAPQPAMASKWDDMWQRRDQQTHQALQAGDLDLARELAEKPLQQGDAAFRAADYESAVSAYSSVETSQGHYNRGNALAQMGRYQDAIAAYDEALALQPEMEDAVHNRAELEKLLQQQQKEQQQKEQQQKEQQKEQQQKEQQQQESKESDKQDKGQGASEQSGNQDGQKGEQDAQPQQADNESGSKEQGNDEAQQADNNDGDAQTNEQGREESQQASQEPAHAAGGEYEPAQDNSPGGEQSVSASAAQHQPQDGSDRGEQSDMAAGVSGAEQSAEEISSDAQTQAEQAQSPAGNPQQSGRENRESEAIGAALSTAESEQQQADERWLRRIPDDPGGLLRRKFLYQYSQRRLQPAPTQNW